MIIKFRIGQTDWKLIDGFKEIHYFNVKKVLPQETDVCQEHQVFYAAWGTEERFNPSTVFQIDLKEMGPTRDIGVIGIMKDGYEASSFLLLGCDEVFILNDEGKTIDRCY